MKKLLLLTCTVLIILTAPMSRTKANSNFQADEPELQCGAKICLRSTPYFTVNYKRIRFFPRDILISGVNLNHPVEVTSVNTILLALRNPSTGKVLDQVEIQIRGGI